MASRPRLVVGGLAAVGLLVIALGSRSGQKGWMAVEAGFGRSASPSEETTVTRVIDGDTIVVAGGRSVRLIGIDAPETVAPRTAVQCFGPEAAARLKELLAPGARVRLTYDLDRTDSSGRTLAYVYRVEDDLFVNEVLARDGFARELISVPNLEHVADLAIAVTEAESERLGLWGACAVTPTTTIRTTITTTPTSRSGPAVTTGRAAPAAPPVATTGTAATGTAATDAAACHPSYVGACIPIGLARFNCADVPGNGPASVAERRFGVVGPDVYGLDPDHNGIACES